MLGGICDGNNGAERSLFGGAFTCFFPDNAQDISTIRDIPDNQEVFCHKSTDQSIMIDILEYQPHVVGEQAPRYHFEDLASSNEAETESEVSFIEAIPQNMISMTQCQEAWFLSGRQMVSKFNENNMAKNLIQMHMVLYRLPQHETDVMVIVNSPLAISNGSSSSGTPLPPNCPEAWSVDAFKQIACSLKLIDPGVFGEE